MTKKALIISGGEFAPCPEDHYHLIIAVDKGAAYAARLGLSPDVLLGDFDSIDLGKEGITSLFVSCAGSAGSTKKNALQLLSCKDVSYIGRSQEMSDTELEISDTGVLSGSGGKQIKVIKLPKQKDDPDTLAAVRYALGEGCTELTIGCIMGGRFDHMLANLQTAAFAASRGVPARLSGANDEIFVFSNTSMEFPRREGWSLSAFSLSDVCKGITITGAVYPAENAAFCNAIPLGLSNDWKDDVVTFRAAEGILAVVQSRIR